MRKFAGVCLAAAMLLPVGLIAASPSGAAAAKPTCKTATGTATFSPALPKIKATTKVKLDDHRHRNPLGLHWWWRDLREDQGRPQAGDRG